MSQIQCQGKRGETTKKDECLALRTQPKMPECNSTAAAATTPVIIPVAVDEPSTLHIILARPFLALQLYPTMTIRPRAAPISLSRRSGICSRDHISCRRAVDCQDCIRCVQHRSRSWFMPADLREMSLHPLVPRHCPQVSELRPRWRRYIKGQRQVCSFVASLTISYGPYTVSLLQQIIRSPYSRTIASKKPAFHDGPSPRKTSSGLISCT